MRDAWFHIIFSTFGTWLRGDRRGFRDHDHRIHSSGDYRRPPPGHEHAGLRRWTVEVMHKDPVRLRPDLRPRVGSALLKKLLTLEVPVLALSVSGDHVHLLGKFPHPTVRKMVGYAKAHASYSIRDEIPGVVFAMKCKVKPIRDRDHHRDTFNYITDHRDEGAWVWTFRECHPFDW